MRLGRTERDIADRPTLLTHRVIVGVHVRVEARGAAEVELAAVVERATNEADAANRVAIAQAIQAEAEGQRAAAEFDAYNSRLDADAARSQLNQYQTEVAAISPASGEPADVKSANRSPICHRTDIHANVNAIITTATHTVRNAAGLEMVESWSGTARLSSHRIRRP